MTSGTVVLLVAVGLAVVVGVWRLLTDGRFRGTHKVRDAPETDAHDERIDVWALLEASGGVGGVSRGERASLVQFSSAFCAPCRATRRILDDVSAVVPGVVHVDIDAEHHLALVRELGILRTPTTLVLDASGREVQRAVGAPRKEDVLNALARLVG